MARPARTARTESTASTDTEAPETGSTPGYDEVNTSHWGPDTRKNSSTSTASSSQQIEGLDEELVSTSYDNIDYGKKGTLVVVERELFVCRGQDDGALCVTCSLCAVQPKLEPRCDYFFWW